MLMLEFASLQRESRYLRQLAVAARGRDVVALGAIACMTVQAALECLSADTWNASCGLPCHMPGLSCSFTSFILTLTVIKER